MAKIRTVNDLDAAIDSEIAWRKQELTTALRLVSSSSGPIQSAHLRAGVLLLYAHWEGWIKRVAQLYIRYVNTHGYSYDALSPAFLGNALKTRLMAVHQSNTPLVHNEFALFIRTDLAKNAALSETLVRTESNLSSTVLFEILDRLGLPRREKYETRALMIDQDLVHRRNTIAHGDYLDLGADDFRTLRANTMELLELFTDDVRNAAALGSHLALPSPAS